MRVIDPHEQHARRLAASVDPIPRWYGDEDALTRRVRGRHREPLRKVDSLEGLKAGTAAGIAERLGVSKRTAYRYLADQDATVEVMVKGWYATFVIREDQPPRRVSEWRRDS